MSNLLAAKLRWTQSFPRTGGVLHAAIRITEDETVFHAARCTRLLRHPHAQPSPAVFIRPALSPSTLPTATNVLASTAGVTRSA